MTGVGAGSLPPSMSAGRITPTCSHLPSVPCVILHRQPAPFLRRRQLHRLAPCAGIAPSAAQYAALAAADTLASAGAGGPAGALAAVEQYSLAAAAAVPGWGMVAALGALALLVLAIKKLYDTPSRTYNSETGSASNVGAEYDAWAQEGILEYYWGEHIHLGYYSAEERRRGYKKKDFKQAKYDFIEEMLAWTGVTAPKRVLDVGCGIGGTTRYLAKAFPDAEVVGITLSPKQVERATALAAERGLTNVKFVVMNALEQTWEDNTFDLVWACESGEHMPDKKRYVEEMSRVLAPGGTLAIATWCQREETPDKPLSMADKAALQFLYDEWAHPYFISYEEYGRLLEGTGMYASVTTDDWAEQTTPSWRHSNWVGVWDPWPVILSWNPRLWYKVTREIVTIERFHRAFERGLCTYGMIKGTKKERDTLLMQGAAAGQPEPVSA